MYRSLTQEKEEGQVWQQWPTGEPSAKAQYAVVWYFPVPSGWLEGSTSEKKDVRTPTFSREPPALGATRLPQGFLRGKNSLAAPLIPVGPFSVLIKAAGSWDRS